MNVQAAAAAFAVRTGAHTFPVRGKRPVAGCRWADGGAGDWSGATGFGVALDGLVGVDLDDLSHPMAQGILACACAGETLTVRSGRRAGGLHVYLRGDLTAAAYPWGSVRSGRQYLVGPGSTHPDGGTYTVTVDAPIADLTEGLRLLLAAPGERARGRHRSGGAGSRLVIDPGDRIQRLRAAAGLPR